jgi:hypothetical protein
MSGRALSSRGLWIVRIARAWPQSSRGAPWIVAIGRGRHGLVDSVADVGHCRGSLADEARPGVAAIAAVTSEESRGSSGHGRREDRVRREPGVTRD